MPKCIQPLEQRTELAEPYSQIILGHLRFIWRDRLLSGIKERQSGPEVSVLSNKAHNPVYPCGAVDWHRVQGKINNDKILKNGQIAIFSCLSSLLSDIKPFLSYYQK